MTLQSTLKCDSCGKTITDEDRLQVTVNEVVTGAHGTSVLDVCDYKCLRKALPNKMPEPVEEGEPVAAA